MKNASLLIMFISLFVGTLVLTGCPPKKKLAIEDAAQEDVTDEEVAEIDETESTEPNIEISQEWTEIPALQAVTFPYDATKIGADQRRTLKENVVIIKKLPESVTVRIAGHCDERGTIEYNIALGQRRASVVKSFYQTAGIARRRLSTISFGEERPVCSDGSDACFAKNRRAVTKVKNPAPISISPEELR